MKRLYLRSSLSLADRFMARVLPQESGCWHWNGSHQGGGYATLWISGSHPKGYAHRVAYQLFKSTIPDGYEIDHLCRNRGCVNPSHLEAVTPQVNVQRGDAPRSVQRRLGVCVRGHPMAPDNRVAGCRWFQCKTCMRDRARVRATVRRASTAWAKP